MTHRDVDFFFPRGQHSIDEIDEHLVAEGLEGEVIERSLGSVGTQGAFRSHAFLVGDDVLLVKHWPRVDAANQLQGLDVDETLAPAWHGPVRASEVIEF